MFCLLVEELPSLGWLSWLVSVDTSLVCAACDQEWQGSTASLREHRYEREDPASFALSALYYMHSLVLLTLLFLILTHSWLPYHFDHRHRQQAVLLRIDRYQPHRFTNRCWSN